MANNKIREDKTCLNCGSYVKEQFCPKCGQKNTESRRSFYSLFLDFFSGFINYDNSFWRTTRTLFLSPGKLSTEYMAGKRKTYLPPVQLYLLASFLAFFLPGIIPSPYENTTIQVFGFNPDHRGVEIDDYGVITTVNELDSLYKDNPVVSNISIFKYYINKLVLIFEEKAAENPGFSFEKEKFIVDYFPKVLFLYMPLFAFFSWLFHNKKKWYYFDSGIFTLHFFSFFLLVITTAIIVYTIMDDWLNWDNISELTFLAFLIYTIFYFFRAHRKFYREKRYISNLKATALFVINTFFIIVTFFGFVILAIYI